MLFFKRTVFSSLKDHLSQPEISLILGPRQAGKTTLMRELAKHLNEVGTPNVYFDLDVLEDLPYFQTQHALINRLQKMVGSQKAVVFIDEVQRLKNAGLFLKGLYDLQTPYKFVVSGSGSLELRADIVEPLTGRKRVFYCRPLSFGEVMLNKLDNKSTEQDCRRLAAEYWAYGGYPRVLLAQTETEKKAVLREIYQSYLEKDIQLLLNVERSGAFSALIRILASQVGGIVNRARLASTIGVTEKTVEKYLFLLEKTFVVEVVRPFWRSVQREITKSPKVYFSDLGFLALARGVFPDEKIEGGTFENACFLRLLELDLQENPHFWRTHSGAEVDFIINLKNSSTPLPVEVKSSGSVKTVGRSLISFLRKYEPPRAFIYTVDQEREILVAGNKVSLVPYSKLITIS